MTPRPLLFALALLVLPGDGRRLQEGQGSRLQNHGAANEFPDESPAVVSSSADDLISKIKNMQRVEERAKLQWWAYCDANGEGVRDPAKHDVSFLQDFLSQYESGVELPSNEVSLAGFINEGQRKSVPFKDAWTQYCQMKGRRRLDPLRHGQRFLMGFLDHIGQAASKQTQGAKRPRNRKARAGGGTDDPEKDALVARVKNFQKNGEDSNQLWWSFCDSSQGGIRDPSRLDVQILRDFCNEYGVP